MPYKSDAQRRYFNWAKEHGKISAKTVNEFNQASKGMKLPEHVKKSTGGIIHNMRSNITGKLNHRVFPPAGVKFASGGSVPRTEEGNNAGLSEEYAGKDEYAVAGGEHDEQDMVDCPMCGHQFAYGGMAKGGMMDSPEEEMMEHEMPEAMSNVSKSPSRVNPDHEMMARRAHFAKAIKRHKGM